MTRLTRTVCCRGEREMSSLDIKEDEIQLCGYSFEPYRIGKYRRDEVLFGLTFLTNCCRGVVVRAAKPATERLKVRVAPETSLVVVEKGIWTLKGKHQISSIPSDWKKGCDRDWILNIELRPPSKNGTRLVQLFQPISGLISGPRSHLPISTQFTI